jgi:uncharacterized protein YlaI
VRHSHLRPPQPVVKLQRHTLMKWNFPIAMMIYCNECERLFDIVIASKDSRNFRCPLCGKVHVFDLETFAEKAVEHSQKMMTKTHGRR